MEDEEWEQPPEPEYPPFDRLLEDAWGRLAIDIKCLQVWEQELKRKASWGPYPKAEFFRYFAILEGTAALTRRLLEWLYLEPKPRYKNHLRASLLLDSKARPKWEAFIAGARRTRAQEMFKELSEGAAHFTRNKFVSSDRLWECVHFVYEGVTYLQVVSRSHVLFSPVAMKKLGLETEWAGKWKKP